MNWLKNLFGGIARYFTSGKAASNTQKALEYVAKALPIVTTLATFITAVQLPEMLGAPPGVDDAVWAAIKTRFPNLFDGRRKTPDEIKADALTAAGQILKAKFPELSTTVAVLAAQMAYAEFDGLAAQSTPPAV